MRFQQQEIPIPSYAGLEIQQSLAGFASKRLMVLLPGAGYFVDSPLLYYLREMAWQAGDDVLSIRYGFQVAQSAYDAEQQAAITQESQESITQALAKGAYEDLFLVGKSLGTPLAALFANHFPETKKVILLTPIQNCHTLIRKTPSLAIIGTDDSRYSPELVQDSEFVKWEVYQGLNHSLEMPNDYQTSLRLLADIMRVCEDFLYP